MRIRLPRRAALGLAAVAASGLAALALTVPTQRTLSMVFEADGQIETATGYLVDWDRRHPLDYDARLHTADLQLLTVHPQEALATLQAMAHDWPDDRQVLERLVSVEDSLLLVDETLDALEKLAVASHDEPAVLHRLVDLYRWKGMTEPLLSALRKLVLVEDAPDERAELIDILLSHARYDELIAGLGPAVGRAPGAIDLRLALYEAYLRTGRFEQAAEQMKQVLEVQPERVELLRPVAEYLVKRGLFDEAVALYRERIDRQPRDARRFQAELNDLFESHAEELVRTGKTEEAVRLYRGRIARAPTDLQLRLELAELYGKRSTEVAVTELKQLLQLQPGSVEAWLALAERQSWRGQLGESVAAYRKVLALEPKNRAARRSLAQHLLWTDHPDDAIREYRVLIAEGGEPADHEALIDLLIDDERGQEALAEAQKLEPTPRHKYLLALALHATGDDKRALPELIEWTRKEGGDVRAWQAIVECATSQDDPDLALQALRRVQALKRQRKEDSE